jgi:hypothetical protein
MPKIVAALLLCSTTALHAALLFDPAAEFSVTENPHGVWTYGYSATLGGNLLSFNGTGSVNSSRPLGVGIEGYYVDNLFTVPMIAHNPTTTAFATIDGSLEPSGLALHPGQNGEYAVLRFRAPDDASYAIAGSFFGDNSAPTTTDAHILVNGVAIFDATVQGFGPASAKTFSATRQLVRGDVIDFAVGYGANNNFGSDLTGLNLNITQLNGVFDAKSDFSATNNPSGAWTFGQSSNLGAPFTPFAARLKRAAMDFWAGSAGVPDPGAGHNPDKAPQALNEIYFQPHEFVLHPGFAGQYAIARWTAPSAGKFLLESSFVGEGGVSTTDVHVRHNGLSLFDGEIHGRSKTTSYSSILTVAAGDSVDFAVGYGSDHAYNSDTTGVEAQLRPITQTGSTNLAAYPAIELAWPVEAGATYQLQSASTIDATTWQNVGAPFRDQAATNLFQRVNNPKLFYRLITYK